jgi:molecular chaperone GrpE
MKEVKVAQEKEPEAKVETVAFGEGNIEQIETEGPAAEGAVAVEEVPAEAGEEQQELEALRDKLAQAEARAAEYLDGWQRAQAEFSNYRKRQDAERTQITALANATLLRRLLPIVDDFERALAILPASLSQMTWCEGVFLIKRKLDLVLESEGVKPIKTEGQMFDPFYHEAVMVEEVSGYGEGQIVEEVQRGYMLGERVLRPALVRVARAPAPQPEQVTDTEEHEAKE